MPNEHASSQEYRANNRISVLLPLPLVGPYDYRAPEGLFLKPGDFVSVPLGKRERIGVVWGPGSDDINEARLKDVSARLECPPMTDVARDFVDWVARYTMSAPGAVLRMAMSVPSALNPAKPIIGYELAPHAPEVRFTAARRRVVNLLAEGPPREGRELAAEAGVGTGVVKGLAAAGVLQTVDLPPRKTFMEPDWQLPGPTLSPDQVRAATDLRNRVVEGGFSVTVLDGVPGSGKTEVYFEALAETLAKGEQVLVLVPEISLTAQWLNRFRDRFGTTPAEWHSDRSPG
ncbi:MAG: DEAD/DEAH box helicase family protein, partial [Rhodospirillales bacterium]|nr:DEAD/DEAH box helicase family protein [Rhodospirillales bacterium]